MERTYIGGSDGSYADIIVVSLINLVIKKGGKVESENMMRYYNTVGSHLGFPALAVEKKKPATGGDKKKDSKKNDAAAPAAAPASAAPAAPLATVDPSTPDYSSNKLLTHLTSLNIASTTHSHTAAFTSDELDAAAGSLGQHTKNLFLKDKKHGLFLVTASPTSDTNTKLLAKSLGLTGANMRMATEELLNTKLDVKKGSLGPMCILADTDKEIKVII